MQTALVSLIVATLFIRPRMHSNTVDEANTYTAILFFLIVFMLFDGFTEVMAKQIVTHVECSSCNVASTKGPQSRSLQISAVTLFLQRYVAP